MNRLASETSPYLLQHKDNPVDWYPWGPEALSRAKTENRPIFLSIGYSACHWCHVMEHESFENPQLAELMNRHFVNIKVDREERPDLDSIYMNAVQIMTGRGGWPMSVFLTPDLQPFFGGTYWPPSARMGMPGFDQVLSAVADAWQNRREQALEQGAQLTSYLRDAVSPDSSGEGDSDSSSSSRDSKSPWSADLLSAAASTLDRSFDQRHGGFGQAPKFPHPMDLRLLLRIWKRTGRPRLLEIVRLTLEKMAAGGIYDHLGGGFHRYSVDERWLVPHFEKMLYDNALLVPAYLDAYLITGHSPYAQVARETLDYVLRDMTDPAGGFYSTEDADSEGHEGKFYVWSKDEIVSLLGPDRSETFCYVYDVTEGGNFERANILNLPKTISQCAAIRRLDPELLARQLAEDRQILFQARLSRVRPGRDDKILVSWNGLMIDALAQAAAALQDHRYLAAASRAADFLLAALRGPDGRLLHSWRNGQARLGAYLDDYAALANGLVSLYEAGFDERYLDSAVELAETMLARFADPVLGGFYFTADDHELLLVRPKDMQDSAVPSGASLAAMLLLRLGKLTGRIDFLKSADETLHSARSLLERHPLAAGQMLAALDFLLGPTPELVLIGASPLDRIIAAIQTRYWPNKVFACRSAADAVRQRSASLNPLFEGKPLDSAAALYHCQDFACEAPIRGEKEISSALDQFAPPPTAP